jgi:chromosome partitioning protein
MRTWALISQKGGSGKSTLSTQLAVYAGSLGEKVVILDTDPQASAWRWHELRGEGSSPPVFRCLPDKLKGVVDALRENGLATLVIIDTAPHTNKGAVEAIRSCDLIICPTRPSMFDVAALQDTVTLIEKAGAKARAVGVINGIIKQGPKSAAVKAYAKAAGDIERFGIRVAASFVSERIAFVHATDQGKGVNEITKAKEAEDEIVRLWGELNETWPVAAETYGLEG